MYRWMQASVAIVATAFAVPAVAATFCAQTAAQLKSALGSSQGNAEDNTIYVKTGNYLLNTALADGLAYGTFAGHGLTLVGSIDDVSVCPPANVIPNLAGAGTTLDGEGAVQPLNIYSGGQVGIKGFTFVSGLTNADGGGLVVTGDDVSITYNRFFGNRASGSGSYGFGGAVNAFSNTTLTFSHNLLVANHGTFVGGASLSATSGGTVKYNTIVANTTDTLSQPGGLRLDPGAGSGASFTLVNNIIWDNHATGGTDLGVFTAQTRATNDLYFPLTKYSTSAGFTSDISVDPQFASCGGPVCLDFELADSSPLLNVGTDPVDPLKLMTDLAGKRRVIGPHTDIGAFENDHDLIFADGFGP